MNAETREPEFTPPPIAEIPLDDVGDEPPRPSRFSNDVRTKSTEETRPPSTGKGAPTGAGTHRAVKPSCSGQTIIHGSH